MSIIIIMNNIRSIKQIQKIIDLFFERDVEYKKNNKFFVSQNNKQMIHYNNMNRRLPFFTYVKVENEVRKTVKVESIKHNEFIEKEREKLYKKYKYIYYPLNFQSKDEKVKK